MQQALMTANLLCLVTSTEVLLFACRSPGLTGSLAILGGLSLHINPYGNLHWNPNDLATGLTCVLPLLLLGKPPSSQLNCEVLKSIHHTFHPPALLHEEVAGYTRGDLGLAARPQHVCHALCTLHVSQQP